MKQQISTQDVADSIVDFLADQYDIGLIPEKVYERRISRIIENSEAFSKLLLEAINRGDIDAMGDLKLESQVIIYVPPGQSEVLLSTQFEGLIYEGMEDEIESMVELGAEQYYMNIEKFLDIGQIRSDKIYTFSSFPIGKTVPSGFYVLTDFDTFSDTGLDPLYSDAPSYYPAPVGHVKRIYYDALNRRFRLPAASTGVYLSCNARIAPSAIDSSAYDSISSYADYKVRTPDYARELLEHYIKKRLIPQSTPSYIALLKEESLIRKNVLSRIQQPTRVISTDWSI